MSIAPFHSISSSDDDSNDIAKPNPSNKRKRRTKEEIEADKQAKVAKQEEKRRLKEIEKMRKEEEKAKKMAEKQSLKALKPGESIRSMTVLLDCDLIKSPEWGARLLLELQSLDGLRINMCQVDPASDVAVPLPGAILWQRDNPLLITEKSIEQDILVVIKGEQFIDMIAGEDRQTSNITTTLATFTTKLLSFNKRITLIIMNMERELRKRKVKLNGVAGTSTGKRPKNFDIDRNIIEMAMVDLQVDSRITCRHCDSADEFADMVRCYTKAVADRPFKSGRLDSEFSFHSKPTNGGCSASAPVSRPMPLTSEPNKTIIDCGGVEKLWRQQLLQFKGVTGDMASAILFHYSTPRSLYNAYKLSENGANLLEDIEIRRGFGVLQNTRRLGKELSRRLYELFMSDDPEFIIK